MLLLYMTWYLCQFLKPDKLRGGACKSLARPRRKQAIATKLGIYSTHYPRNSIHYLARCSNFCKPLKKIQKLVRPTRSPRQQWPPRPTKDGDLSIVFSVQGIGVHYTTPWMWHFAPETKNSSNSLKP